MRLSDLCTIHSGLTARGRLEPASSGGVLVIQLRDVSGERGLDPAGLSRVSLEGGIERYLVRAGDVVFRSRGERNTASVLGDRFIEPAVAILPLFILRPARDRVEPNYLAWAINQPSVQRHFDGAARGTNMRMVPRSALDSLEIDVPDLTVQRKIVAVDALAERERALVLQVADARRQLTRMILAEHAKRLSPSAGRKRMPK